MSGQRRRWWANISPALCQSCVFEQMGHFTTETLRHAEQSQVNQHVSTSKEGGHSYRVTFPTNMGRWPTMDYCWANVVGGGPI